MSTSISGAHAPWTRRVGHALPGLSAPRGAAVERALDIPIARETRRQRERVLYPHARPAPRFQPRARADAVNRVVNVLLAVVALAMLLPVLLLVALAIKLNSRGPVFYSQVRVGLDRQRTAIHALYDRRKHDSGGRLFTIYKFRSMHADAEEHCGAVWATPEDSRVTMVGRFLRRTRLDEVPQLVNVLRGDMNIVGPRPERPSIFADLRDQIPNYGARQRVRPGITGWAQIHHSYDTSLDDVRTKLQYDLAYLERQSLALDLKIMLMTVPVLVFRKGGW
jgi:lipopolysaccharide/colanic/teichoic acid biosynthesis glycosyltransferase